MIQAYKDAPQSWSEGELWRQYHCSRNNDDRNKLVEYYRPLVKKRAEKIHWRVPPYIDLEDLIQEGIFGLIDAVEKYDPSLDVKFETYCYPKINGSILNALREDDWVPKLVRMRSKQVEKAKSRLGYGYSREDLIDELSKDTYVDPNLEGREKALMILRETETIDRITHLSGIPHSMIIRKNILKDYRLNVPEDLEKKDLVFSLISGLKKRYQSVIILHYYKNMKIKEIGELFGTTLPGASMMKRRILNQLREQIRIRGLDRRDFALGRVGGIDYKKD
jgi:RNA polymerase sigma factor for flagellar operon FliA